MSDNGHFVARSLRLFPCNAPAAFSSDDKGVFLNVIIKLAVLWSMGPCGIAVLLLLWLAFCYCWASYLLWDYLPHLASMFISNQTRCLLDARLRSYKTDLRGADSFPVSIIWFCVGVGFSSLICLYVCKSDPMPVGLAADGISPLLGIWAINFFCSVAIQGSISLSFHSTL
jgi:hypothetical protein